MFARGLTNTAAAFQPGPGLAGLARELDADADVSPSARPYPSAPPFPSGLPSSNGSAAPASGNITVLIAAARAQQALGAHQVAAAIEEGIHAAMPGAKVLKLPDLQASAGFVEEVVRLSGGAITRIGVLGLRGDGPAGRLGLLGPLDDLTAVIGIDEAAELGSLAPEDRDPTRASSRRAGRLILAALDHGARRIIIGCGDSGANDGGIGMANVLGIRFFDASRSEIVEAGGLLRLATIDMSHRDPRLDQVSIEAVVNTSNDLLGARGVTRVYGESRGASAAQVLRLERGLARYAVVVQETLGVDVAGLPGGGASGGLAAGLVAFLGARLTSPFDFLQVCPGLQEILGTADLVMTVDEHPESLALEDARLPGEAGAAAPTDRVPAWVTRQAEAKGLPVIALPGEPFVDAGLAVGAGALPAVRAALFSGEQAARHASARLREASTAALRSVLSGWDRAAEQA